MREVKSRAALAKYRHDQAMKRKRLAEKNRKSRMLRRITTTTEVWG